MTLNICVKVVPSKTPRISGTKKQTVRYLLRRRANLDYRGRFASALGAVAGYGHMEIVRTLIEHGAKVNEARPSYEIPLLRAAHNSHVEVVYYLLQHGVDLSYEDCANRTLEDAAFEGHDSVVPALVEAGVNVNSDGRTSQARFGSPLLAAKSDYSLGLEPETQIRCRPN